MKQRIISVLTIGGLLLIIIAMCIFIFGGGDKSVQDVTAETTTTIPTTIPVTVVTTVPVSVTSTVPDITTTAVPAVNTDVSETTAAVTTTQAVNTMPQTTKEIIDKYTQLVNDFKSERPAYKKKEFQALPEEHRNFGTAINFVLNIASGYMVTEEE